MPRCDIDIQRCRKAPSNRDPTPQELTGNSLEPCLSNELLNICTQIRKEYKEDTFGVLPTRIHFLGDAKADPFSKQQLAQLPPLINAMVLDFGNAQSEGTKPRRKKHSHESIARNLHLVQHVNISIIIDTDNAEPRNAISLVAGSLAAQVQSFLGLLFTPLTTSSIRVEFKNINEKDMHNSWVNLKWWELRMLN